VSWQLAAFALLGVALIVGFGWYERAQPDARIVALVATLAALAALGRIAFAALPNVKPTTDIVLISGYALGGAPGFAIGAIAGLTSNFFFGQGPWTPWQMVAWGATGLLGAGLAVATGRRIGRIPLALFCGIVGYGFAAFQDVGDWVNYSDHSLAQLGVYVGKGTGFDFIHAAGCAAFALAIVIGDPVGSDQPVVVCLDEPTRGMDRAQKQRLATLLRRLPAAVVVATHDPEFVAAFAQRVVLLADGAPIADGSVAEVLAGGTYFATETARILGGAGAALTPDDGVALLQRKLQAEAVA